MNSSTLQYRTTGTFRVATLFVQVLLLSIASYSPALSKQAAFLINHPLNPLKSFAVDSKKESHPFFVDIDGDGDYECFIGEGNTGAILLYKNAGTAAYLLFEKPSEE